MLTVFLPLLIFRESKKHRNINKVAGLSRDWVGAKNLFMCFLFRSFLMGEKKHINKIPPKIPGQSRENFVTCFYFYVFFSLPRYEPSLLCVLSATLILSKNSHVLAQNLG